MPVMDPPIGADNIAAWLDENPTDPAPLVRWLQGYDMPFRQPGVDTYQSLQGWLPADRRLRPAQRRLAALLQTILYDIADGELLDRVRLKGEFLYNVGMFCAFVGCPDVLAEPLEHLVQDLEGARTWGDDPKRAFRLAVQHNDDGRFKSMWSTMAKEGSHPFFGNDVRNAVRGLVWTPPSGDSARGPDWDELGRALKCLATRIENHKSRSLEFCALVEEMRCRYPDILHSAWYVQVFRLANTLAWPAWAVQSLPSTFAVLRQDTETFVCYTSCYAADLVQQIRSEELDLSQCESLCNGFIVVIELPVSMMDDVIMYSIHLDSIRCQMLSRMPNFDTAMREAVHIYFRDMPPTTGSYEEESAHGHVPRVFGCSQRPHCRNELATAAGLGD